MVLSQEGLTVLHCDGKLLGNGPPTSHEFTRTSHGDNVRLLAACGQWSVALTEPHLGFPTDVLDDLGLLF